MCARSGPSAGSVCALESETPAASAWPAISGAARTASRTSSTVAVPVETAARTAPPSRSRRVIARVSIP